MLHAYTTMSIEFTMKPQEVKPEAQTDWLGFCKA